LFNVALLCMEGKAITFLVSATSDDEKFCEGGHEKLERFSKSRNELRVPVPVPFRKMSINKMIRVGFKVPSIYL